MAHAAVHMRRKNNIPNTKNSKTVDIKYKTND